MLYDATITLVRSDSRERSGRIAPHSIAAASSKKGLVVCSTADMIQYIYAKRGRIQKTEQHNMPQNVIAAVDDMFFASKIRAVAEHLGLSVTFAKSVAAVIEAARKE